MKPLVLLQVIGTALLIRIVELVDVLLDICFGITIRSGTRRQRETARLHYEKSAQVVNIVWKSALTPRMDHTLDNFFYVHEEFINPDTLIGDDRVVLYGINTTHAFFCVMKPGSSVYSTRKYPFVFMAFYELSEKLIIIPHEHFHKLADKIGDPTKRRSVGIISMTARCGSTLLCQMLYNVPDIHVMAEPWALVYLHELYVRRKISAEQNERLIRSCIQVQLKPEVSRPNDKTVVMKLPPYCSSQMVIISKLFPRIKLIFNARHPLPSIKSWMKLLTSYDDENVVPSWATKEKPVLWNWCLAKLALPYEDKEFESFRRQRWTWLQGNVTDQEVYFWGFCGCFLSYMQHKKKFSMGILYEDIVGAPEKSMKELFKVLGIPEEHVILALEGLKHDSQNQTFGVRENNDMFTPDKQLSEMINNIFKEFKVPLSLEMTTKELRSVMNLH